MEAEMAISDWTETQIERGLKCQSFRFSKFSNGDVEKASRKLTLKLKFGDATKDESDLTKVMIQAVKCDSEKRGRGS